MSVNKVILLGNVGRDPEMNFADAKNPVASFPLATNERTAATPTSLSGIALS